MSTWFLILSIFVVFLLLETPLFTVIAGLTAACLFNADGDWLSLQTILIELNRLAEMPVLVAFPLFTFVGCLLTESGSPRRIMDFLQSAVGWLPGGVAMAAVGACAFFAALTGASGVTIVALGGVLYPVLRQQAYGENFTLGLLTSSGSLGLLFPPSLPIILYGVVARVDIRLIFKAALIPGSLSILALCVYAFIYQYRRRHAEPSVGGATPFSWQGTWKTFLGAAWDWPIVIIIIGGVYGGFVTIAEVSAVVTVYVLVVECLILKEIHIFRQVPRIIVESVMLSGAVMIILGVALGFTGYLVDERVPNQILGVLTRITENRWMFLAGLNLFLLVVGCLMDIFSAIVIVVPIILPVAAQYGIDPLHLCVIFLLNLEIGYSTPPVGMNLFISSLKFQKPVTVLYRASIPYLAILFLVLILVTYLPALSLGFY